MVNFVCISIPTSFSTSLLSILVPETALRFSFNLFSAIWLAIKPYSENARVCAKWQWNARDCVTGLRDCDYWIQSRAFHCHLAHTRAFSLLSHTYCVQTQLRWLLSNEFNTKKVTRIYIFFKFAICSFALLSRSETCHSKGRDMVTVWRTVLLLSCYDFYSTHQHDDVTRFEYVLWCCTMHEWVMNIHHPNLNRPRAIHKHDPHPLETMGHVW